MIKENALYRLNINRSLNKIYDPDGMPNFRFATGLKTNFGFLYVGDLIYVTAIDTIKTGHENMCYIRVIAHTAPYVGWLVLHDSEIRNGLTLVSLATTKLNMTWT